MGEKGGENFLKKRFSPHPFQKLQSVMEMKNVQSVCTAGKGIAF